MTDTFIEETYYWFRDFFKNLKKRLNPFRPKPTGRTWDYTNSHWGHSIAMSSTVDEEKGLISVTGWSSMRHCSFVENANFPYCQIQRGDDLLFWDNEQPPSKVYYRAEKVSYYHDPPDMFRATLRRVVKTEKEKE